MFNVGWRPVFLHFSKLFQLDPVAGHGHDGDLFQVGDGVPVFLFQAYDDVVLVAFFPEFRHLQPVDPVPDIGRHRGTVKAVQGKLFSVEHDLQLGLVLFAAYGDILCTGNTVQLKTDLFGQRVGLLKVVSEDLHIHLVAASSEHAAGSFYRIVDDLGNGIELVAEILCDLKNRTFTFRDRDQSRHEIDPVRSRGVEKREKTAFLIGAGRYGDHGDFRIALPDDLFDLAGCFHGFFHP